jgi:hypothetical protein
MSYGERKVSGHRGKGETRASKYTPWLRFLLRVGHTCLNVVIRCPLSLPEVVTTVSTIGSVMR